METCQDGWREQLATVYCEGPPFIGAIVSCGYCEDMEVPFGRAVCRRLHWQPHYDQAAGGSCCVDACVEEPAETRSGRVPILVTTDVAARGFDILSIKHLL